MLQRLLGILSHPSWQGLGTLITLVGVVGSGAFYFLSPQTPSASAPTNTPSQAQAPTRDPGNKSAVSTTVEIKHAPTPLPPPIRASVPPPAAPQQAAVETPAAPVAPRTPEPPLPCAHVTLPIKPAALATSADRVCAIAVCTGQPADAPAIDAVRKWLALARAKSGAKCDVADREALGDDAVLKRLLAIAATEPATKKGDERLSCFDAREAINDELQKASEKLQTSIDDAKRCGAKAQKETSEAVTAVVQALQ